MAAWEVISTVRVAGGKIAERRWSHSDVAGLREQLDGGKAPVPTELDERI